MFRQLCVQEIRNAGAVRLSHSLAHSLSRMRARTHTHTHSVRSVGPPSFLNLNEIMHFVTHGEVARRGALECKRCSSTLSRAVV